ncbi:hybrid sensor histidine kinase/response regulator [Segetibacter sp. 3557_3]|uniref:hybrid sensor histidine kinase/response regulator n=1 Tax=Segetibacter sp. 3557_3 TaxID=2547429 RepID=UPI001058C98A|nr:ATP-binding protein [Segetibacter sp. 3557_3]TDH29058.1 hybrid sensor histidine kinase/response regulator [Segetibacter sp. 3557_3]
MILIVDDKRENLYSLKTLLQLHVYEVDTASSGEESLKKILKQEYELIILDVQMPGMDGFEVAEIISGYSRSKDIPIIFLSAVNIDKRFITRGYSSGGVDYITKPFDPDVLMMKVKTFTRLYKQTKELNDIKHLLEQKVEERTRALVDANKKLEMSNAELQQYASIASHDLQEPLRKITTFSRLILDRFLLDLPTATQYLRKVISSSERMQNLINDLLNYSKLSIVPKFTLFDIGQLVQETVVDLELLISEKKAVVETGTFPEVEVIPDQIRQVFQNLISNALKFSKKDIAPKIVLSSELVEAKSFSANVSAKGDFCRITISDNGIGFNDKYLDKIFTMFQRLHTREEYAGTGIGLTIVKKIVERHSGIITADSKEGEGTTFIIVLPVRQRQAKITGIDKI